MRILIDIGHPAHIHYFKNCVKILSLKEHSFFFTVRERDSTIELIKSTGFDYISRGKGGNNILSKLMLMPLIDCRVYKAAKKFNPDLFLSFSSPYAAQVAWIMRKPHIAVDDTEHAVFGQLMYRPFTNTILSPSCYNKKISKKQILFDSLMDFAYLHPCYFKPDVSIRKELQLKDDEKFCILRFVSWDANHDIGEKGLSLQDKIRLVNHINNYCKVFISSEQALPHDLLPYKLNVHPAKLHSVLAEATLYIGEGGTTASESCVLGTPAIYVNRLSAGVFDTLKQYGLLFQLLDIDSVIRKANEILSDTMATENFKKKSEVLLNEKIDATAFFVWFIEKYPESHKIMKEDLEYQYRFKF